MGNDIQVPLNRSIVCEEDSYFMELVRYIHLNPLATSTTGPDSTH